MINSYFTNNTANRDGGVINMDSGTVSNCNFINNSASYNAGAISFGGDNGNALNCNFINNTAVRCGAIYLYSGSVNNCNFTDNTAFNEGGAIYMYSGAVMNCNFTGNNAVKGSAINIMGYGITVSNSIFLKNQANVGDTPLSVVLNENNITITFTGQNNLINAIY